MELNSFGRFLFKIVDIVNRAYPRKSQVRNAVVPPKLREAVRHGARLAAEHHLVVGTLGEISQRLPGGKFLINLRGSWFPALSDDDFAVVSIHGQWTGDNSQLARHANWHRTLYFSSEARTILLCQPVKATLLAAKGFLPYDHLLVDAPSEVGELQLVKAENLDFTRTLKTNKGLLFIRGYGILAWGEDPNIVIGVVELVEHWSDITLASILLDKNLLAKKHGDNGGDATL